jgi:hypothetical protein
MIFPPCLEAWLKQYSSALQAQNSEFKTPVSAKNILFLYITIFFKVHENINLVFQALFLYTISIIKNFQ